jgi:hypothetical protein
MAPTCEKFLLNQFDYDIDDYFCDFFQEQDQVEPQVLSRVKRFLTFENEFENKNPVITFSNIMAFTVLSIYVGILLWIAVHDYTIRHSDQLNPFLCSKSCNFEIRFNFKTHKDFNRNTSQTRKAMSSIGGFSRVFKTACRLAW